MGKARSQGSKTGRGEKKRSVLRRVGRWCFWVFLGLAGFTVAEVFVVRLVNPPFTVSMVLEWVRHGGDVRWIHLRKNWRTLGEISPDLRKAVLAAEDQRFLSHHGFDFIELRHAVADVLSGKGVRGASTISMQTARTVFLCHDRNLIRKIAEAYYTALLEFFCSKKRILEIYLNTVDWGRGARGAESACRLYFERSCGEITRKQAARLAAILPSPHRWSPVNPGKIVLRREKRILQDLSRMPAL